MLLVHYARIHLAYTAEQGSDRRRRRYHVGTVPRVGGLAFCLGLLAALAWSGWRGLVGREAAYLILAALPALAAGLAEDITKRVTPQIRLLATLLAALLAVVLLQAYIHHVQIGLVDAWLSWRPPQWTWAPLGVLLTIIGVAGVANAINIIDGFHGLAAAVCIIMMGAIGYVGWIVGDTLIVQLALAYMGALLGFLLWNYPKGLIFLGDGGAYLAGFLLAQAGVLLVVRNPQVTPWFVLLVCAYPVVETLFSIYRKAFVRNVSPTMPDGLHMHMLVYRRLLRWSAGNAVAREVTARNAATSPYLWALCSLAVVPAVLLWSQPIGLQIALAVYVFIYIAMYVRLVRFRSPSWLRRHIGSR
ncbi:MAG: glycosyltransferase [Tepidimonas sp.]|uniref:MraY family glycosyltransferase n=1 Tax=Tepidimonas sp. TaxID=2002775 RepID=UPI00298F3E2C|nr:glycosyltransferase [Tepidimonas sp.]MCS6809674.1 glycosyltransferase [Tepidimonas sp.]MDW8337333.1 glycosyltransferase [Tepidimonas sp.]